MSPIYQENGPPANKPSFSVVIPAYNAEDTITHAIESILKQSCPVEEIIIIDDGSTDGTRDLLQHISQKYTLVRCFFTPNGGAASARNLGVKHAKSDWIAFLDADDAWHPNKLQQQSNLLAQEPVLSAVSTWGCYSHAGQSVAPIHIGPLTATQLARLRSDGKPVWLLTPSVVIKKSVFQDLCGFRNFFSDAGEDLDLWSRLAHRFNVATIPCELVFCGLRPTSLSMKKQHLIYINTLYIRGCASGNIYPDNKEAYEQFRLKWNSRSVLWRLRSYMKPAAREHLRRGGFLLLTGHRLSGILHVVYGTLLAPVSSARKLLLFIRDRLSKRRCL
jgi:glycosyltransferase involved in cell wall biosynthesis